ncbi:hypothetical protein GJAV_G00194270 [Gymnothorax javanicus]|nr:hypothetical protein GJAV_G00194270 [Gymnothorax javanicus]
MTDSPLTTTPAIQQLTTAAPPQTDSAVIGVVIALVLLTMLGLAFLLYCYLCHNRGAYRTTGEPAPGEDSDPDPVEPSEKKEYFI